MENLLYPKDKTQELSSFSQHQSPIHFWFCPSNVVTFKVGLREGRFHRMVDLSSAFCFAQGDCTLGNKTDTFWSLQDETLSEKQWGGAILYTEGSIFMRLLSFIGLCS
jgi:hypothetical protein